MAVNEAQWVEVMAKRLRESRPCSAKDLVVETKEKIPYGYEVRAYGEASNETSNIRFETDLAILEKLEANKRKPRIIIEAKIRSINTHDAITYSYKAAAHKAVHPYLRYGIMLGDRKHFPLPGRLYRHGAHFDFMISFKGTTPTSDEMARFNRVLRAELRTSRALERILYDSRRRDREQFTLLHRRLHLE